jgi:hypothetical protein
MVANVDVSAVQARHKVDAKFRGVGVDPENSKSIFCVQPEQIADCYKASGEPVPILVEWRLVGDHVPAETPIAWEQALTVTVLFDVLSLSDTPGKAGGLAHVLSLAGSPIANFMQGRAFWKLSPSCTLNGVPVFPSSEQPTSDSSSWGPSRVLARETYRLNLSASFEAFEGDRVLCRIEGNVRGHGKDGDDAATDLPAARMGKAWVVTSAGPSHGDVLGESGDIRYSVTYNMRAEQK